MVRNAAIRLVSNTVMFYITLYLFTKTISKAESGGIPFFRSGADYVLTAAILPAVFIFACRALSKKLPVRNKYADAALWAEVFILLPLITYLLTV